jgi:D-glycero-beta-D-manno-heptose 1-phosphate adenylyltransferase
MKKSWKEESQKKIVQPKEIEKLVSDLRACKKTIATLNGSFDLLHAGHLQIIFEASLVADVLIVALNSDDSIKRYKSPERPIIPLEYRLEMMAALSFVDYVTWFEETDPRETLKRICPDVHVNGAEYGEDCIEAPVVRQGGGRIHLVKRIPSLSTTEIIEKICRCEQ